MTTSRPTAATAIPYRSLPRGDYELVARCEGSIQDIAKRNDAKAERRNVKLEGGPSRALAIQLRSGRHAQLLEYDHSPRDVEVYLEVIEDRFVYRSDLQAVSGIIGVPVEDLSWIAGSQIVRWR